MVRRVNAPVSCTMLWSAFVLVLAHNTGSGVVGQPLIDAPTADFSAGCDYDILAPSVTDVCSCVKLVTSVLYNGTISPSDIASSSGFNVVIDGDNSGCYGCFNDTSGQLDPTLTEEPGLVPSCNDAGVLSSPFLSPLLAPAATSGVVGVFNYRCIQHGIQCMYSTNPLPHKPALTSRIMVHGSATVFTG